MAIIRLPTDFKDFLRLLNSQDFEYLVVRGYPVAFHGHPRAIGDLDVSILAGTENVERVGRVLRMFGFSAESAFVAVRVEPARVIRMGIPLLRIELFTGISGVDFGECHSRRVTEKLDEIDVAFISLPDLLTNKRAAGRARDIADMEELK